MDRKRIFTSLGFFITGIILFWVVYRGFDLRQLKVAIQELRFKWIIISIAIGLLSHFLRAVRWKMLIETLKYKAGIKNLFLSVLVLYFTNLIIPRGGEISRCAVISKYEKIPFVKLIGTVFIERLTDLIAFLIIFLIILFWQFGFFKTVFSYPEFRLDFSDIHSNLLILLMVVALISVIIFILVKFKFTGKILLKFRKLKEEFIEGILVIIHMKGRLKYIILTLLIFLLWVLMYYVVFLAYPPTDKLSFRVAVLTYAFGTLAYLLPIQAGIGAWHFIIISCLYFYGIDKETGMIFALVAHTFTNLIFLVFGPIALALLPIINGKTSIAKESIPLKA
ncbi:MAG: flippase-like domain-containing protein [Bacteroidales bacterium]|jgi:hypothetical protein|nr:flippase-like domain-containing protein [Bacteroidales bacterium]